MTIEVKGRASLWLDDYLSELRKYPHRYADDIEGLERVAALLQSQAAEIERLTRERDGLVSRNAVLAADGTAARKGAANNHAALSEALEVVTECRSALAMMVDPKSIKGNSIPAAWATCVAAETRSRAFLSKYGREGK